MVNQETGCVTKKLTFLGKASNSWNCVCKEMFACLSVFAFLKLSTMNFNIHLFRPRVKML